MKDRVKLHGDAEIERLAAVKPTVGETISLSALIKAKGIKEGEELDYTTPMGLQIKAKVQKGKAVNEEFFHRGERIEPIDVKLPSDETKRPGDCYWTWCPWFWVEDAGAWCFLYVHWCE